MCVPSCLILHPASLSSGHPITTTCRLGPSPGFRTKPSSVGKTLMTTSSMLRRIHYQPQFLLVLMTHLWPLVLYPKCGMEQWLRWALQSHCLCFNVRSAPANELG